MKSRRIPVTAKKVDELMALFRALPSEPVGEHLSDDEFIGYTMGTLPAEQVTRLEVHLDSCLDCAAEVERLLEAAEAWRTEEGKQRLAALRERLLRGLPTSRPSTPSLWERLAAYLRDQVLFPNVGLPQATALAATQPPWWDGQTEDGTLRWRIVEDEEGNLIVRFGSHDLDLEGARLRLRAGDWQSPVIVLERVTHDQVGAETVITREQREQLPEDAVLRVELVHEELEPGSTRPED